MKNIFIYILIAITTVAFAQNNLNEKQRLTFENNFFDGMNERLKANYEKSNEFFEQCLSIDAQNDVILFKMAQNYLDNNQPQEALTYIEKAKEYNAKNKWYQKTFIEIKIALDTDQNEIVKLINLFKEKANNRYIINDLYRKMYYRNRPKDSYTTSKKRTSKKELLTNLFLSENYKKTISVGEKQLEEHPEDAYAYYYIAKSYFKINKKNNALEYLDMGIDFTNNDKRLLKKYYKLYIDIYQSKGKNKQVKKYQEKLSKI